MKVYKALLPLTAALIMAGCGGSRGTAQSVIGQADGALTSAKEEAAVIAPEELKAAEATVAHMKQSFDARDYKVVIAEVPKFNDQLRTLKEAVASKQTAEAAAAVEWSTLNEQVPKSVEEVQARVDSLKPAALPKDVTKEELETAKTELAAAKTTWEEATAAASAGHTSEAAEKGRTVLAKVEELKNSLGMNETLASAG
jgi:hypothetical protein